jgi:hypothetical protein
MNTTEHISPPRAPSAPEPGTDARRDARPSASEPPTLGEILAEEVLPLIGVVAVAGPPVVLLAGPLLLFGLMLFPPFALVVTLVVALVAAAVLGALTGAILAMPYLLVRHTRSHRAAHAISGPAAQLAPVQSPRAAA